MTSTPAPFPLSQGKGAAYVHTTIVALVCNDGGAEIACTKCGHTFVSSNPFTDESHPMDNIELAKALWSHLCANEGRKWREVTRRGRKSFR